LKIAISGRNVQDYAGKIGQVSLAVGGSGLVEPLRGDGTRLEGRGRDSGFDQIPSHYFSTTN
jgi:hypothetical protein